MPLCGLLTTKSKREAAFQKARADSLGQLLKSARASNSEFQKEYLKRNETVKDLRKITQGLSDNLDAANSEIATLIDYKDIYERSNKRGRELQSRIDILVEHIENGGQRNSKGQFISMEGLYRQWASDPAKYEG